MIILPAVLPIVALSLALAGPPQAPGSRPGASPIPAAPAPAAAPIGPGGALAAPPPGLASPTERALTAAAEVAGLNLGVWAFLHYVSNEFYSYISTETMLDNVRDGWEWDRSRYFINFYHHPYHGYLYYSAGRANGLGFWGSCLAALGGSFMWEMMMEKYRPSINDLITTTAGGIVYGEMGYRFSALVRKRGARGLGRVWREALGTILDPVGGVNRLLNGHGDSDPRLPGSPDAGRILDGELIVTGPVITRSAELTGTRTAPLLGFTLRYGDAAGTGWSGRPFDVFSVAGRMRWGPDRPHLSLFINGALFGRAYGERRDGGGGVDEGGPAHFLGIYQHYEYYGFETMRLSGTSFTGGWTSRLVLSPEVRLTASARLGWLGLGASDDFLPQDGDRRNYNLATGVTAAADLGLAAKGFDYLSVVWRHYRLFDLDVIGSRVGRETWNIVQAQVCLPVWSRLGVGLEAEFCSRRFNFRDFPAGGRSLVEARAFFVWQF